MEYNKIMANENNATVVCIASIRLLVPMSHSLKDKRKQIKSIKEKLKSRFNASVAEISLLDDWQHAELGIAMISNDKVFLEKQFRAMETLILESRGLELIGMEIECL